MKRYFYLFIAVMLLSFDVAVAAERFEDVFEPVEIGYIEGNRLVERDYGFVIEKPGSEWSWYKSKKPVSQRDYVLSNDVNNYSYIFQFNKRWAPLNEHSIKDFIKGVMSEAKKSGFTVDVISYETIGVHDRYDFVLSYRVASENDGIVYDMNAYVLVIDGRYISIQQYQNENFGIMELRSLINNIEYVEPIEDLKAEQESFDFYIGTIIGQFTVSMIAAGILVYLMSLLIKSLW